LLLVTDYMVELTDNLMRIKLKHEIDESYDIIFGNKLFPQIALDLKGNPLGSRYAIVTDSNVRGLYAKSLEDALRNEGIETQTFTFEAGEQNKTIDSCMKIIGEMSRLKYGRDAVILALGGGVVGDMAGFMAAIFNRGIPYIQIPTTVLAQADSSIGGKTAVDTEYGKNLIGSFKQPEKVYIDVATLKTLSKKDYKMGLAETIKHSVIQDVEFFKYLQDNVGIVLERSSESSLYIARNNCRIKGNVVEIDPHEKGLRRILNYGHTAGHAIEKLSDFELSHGESVAIGMMVAGRVAHQLGYFAQEDLESQSRLLTAVGLPITIPNGISNESIVEVTSRDKKAKDGKARYVLPISIGRMHEFNGEYAVHVDNTVVMNALQQTR
jgi:3-dehydroquinate synthase